jgi:thiamine-phosphate pyrophosphorylase
VTGVPSRRLVAITDRHAMVPAEVLAGGSIADLAAAFGSAIARVRVGVVQVREPGLDGAALLALVRAAIATGARVIVNDRLDVALAAGATGVHLPERGLTVRDARAVAPAGFGIGCSRHTPAAVRAALDAGADWVQLGPVFGTPGKPPPIGVEALRAACVGGGAVVAVGGFDRAERVRAARDAGADAVAAIRAVWRDGFEPAAFLDGWS